jgi:multiple sugar transport system permease protein
MERSRWRTLGLYGCALLAAIYLVAPFSWLVITSFMSEGEARSIPPHFYPHQPTIQNYLTFLQPGGRALYAQRAVEYTPRAILNSAIVAFSVALLNLTLGSMAAYSFARLDFRGNRLLLGFYLMSRMVPAVALMIPMYILIKGYGMLDHLLSLILAYLTFTLPFTIWILKSYFQTIPRDLEDAARVDRCTWVGMMWRVFLPVATPGLVAAGMFAFMTSWNEFLYALLFTSTIKSLTAPVIASWFATDLRIEYTFMMTGGVLTVVPPLVLALLFQRLIIQGLVSGSVKG